MNPYAAKQVVATKTKSTLAHEALFAAEVYREDDDGGPDQRDSDARQILGDEIVRLRTEFRGEARAIRSALNKTPKVPAELLAELSTLRAAVDELFLSQTSSPTYGGSDPLSMTIRKAGIEGGVASTFARGAKNMKASATVTTLERLRAVTPAIVETVQWAPAWFHEGPTLIALVGPAGVGKTTTAAKLAARARMARKTVALVSCDSFRMGAMDQLEKYAELLDARFHTATTQAELLDIICCEDADVIIVDTSGRAVDPNATEAVLASEDIREAQRNPRNIEVLLCVPASLRAADAARVHRDFAIVQPTALCVTKIDETDSPAGIAHAAFATNLPVSTLCAGQRVPEDIAPANDELIADLLFPMAMTLMDNTDAEEDHNQ